jgi:hypothetical protein
MATVMDDILVVVFLVVLTSAAVRFLELAQRNYLSKK